MKLVPAQRRAEDFAAALDSGDLVAADRLVPGAAALVSAATAVRPVVPEAQFSTALRKRLVAVAAVQSMAEPAPRRSRIESLAAPRVQRRVGVLAGAAAGVVALSGVGVASERSLPGDPFYGVKRAAESAELATAGGDLGKGATHLEQAERRLSEVTQLAGDTSALSSSAGRDVAFGLAWGDSTAERIDGALADMDESTRSGARRLTAAFADGKTVALERLAAFSERQSARLDAVIPLLPSELRDDAAASAALLDRLTATAMSLEEEGGESPGAVPTRPGASASTSPSARPDPATPSGGPAPLPGTSTGGVPSPKPTVPGVLPTTDPVPTTLPTPGLPTPPVLPTPTLPPVGSLPDAVPSAVGAVTSGVAVPQVSAPYSLPLP